MLSGEEFNSQEPDRPACTAPGCGTREDDGTNCQTLLVYPLRSTVQWMYCMMRKPGRVEESLVVGTLTMCSANWLACL